MGSDGTSVMLGKKSGVLALLKEQPSLIGVHCSAHRLELCYKDAMKKVPMAEKSINITHWIILHVLKQSPQQNQLEECIQVSEHKH